MGGTSQATPHVSGAVAVLRAAFPDDTLDETVARLTSTGVPITDSRNGVTVPRLDILAAVVTNNDQIAVVPDVVGLTQALAEATINATNLTVGTVSNANNDTVPAGDVISQNPAPGTDVLVSSAVDLVVSLGPALVTVPDVVGETQALAEATINATNLTVGTVSNANSDTAPAGDVISQNPAPGTDVLVGSAVDLVVSLGPAASSLGDVGPRGNPDGIINLGDLLVLTRIVTGVIQTTALESILGDLNSDGQIDVADLLLLQQAVLNGTVP
jgi:subtilisin family serine protease